MKREVSKQVGNKQRDGRGTDGTQGESCTQSNQTKNTERGGGVVEQTRRQAAKHGNK